MNRIPPIRYIHDVWKVDVRGRLVPVSGCFWVFACFLQQLLMVCFLASGFQEAKTVGDNVSGGSFWFLDLCIAATVVLNAFKR